MVYKGNHLTCPLGKYNKGLFEQKDKSAKTRNVRHYVPIKIFSILMKNIRKDGLRDLLKKLFLLPIFYFFLIYFKWSTYLNKGQDGIDMVKDVH